MAKTGPFLLLINKFIIQIIFKISIVVNLMIFITVFNSKSHSLGPHKFLFKVNKSPNF